MLNYKLDFIFNFNCVKYGLNVHKTQCNWIKFLNLFYSMLLFHHNCGKNLDQFCTSWFQLKLLSNDGVVKCWPYLF